MILNLSTHLRQRQPKKKSKKPYMNSNYLNKTTLSNKPIIYFV